MLSLKSPATDIYAGCSLLHLRSVWMHAARLAATVVLVQLENAGLDPRNGLELGTCAALL